VTYAVLIKLKAPYGISVYQPQASTTAPAYPLPPPTTLVGALAYPYLRKSISLEVDVIGEKLYSPARRLLGKVIYASAGAEGHFRSRDIERIFQVIYMRKEHWDKYEMFYSIGVRGVTYYLDENIYIFYIISDPSLLNYVYGIVRLGRKESIVVVEDVVIEKLENAIRINDKDSFDTFFYFPTRVANCPGETAYTSHMPKLSEINFTSIKSPETEEYCIPLKKIHSELKGGGALISIDEFEIPVPKEVIGGVRK
jgi:CRISPR-associated protein Cas5a/b/c